MTTPHDSTGPVPAQRRPDPPTRDDLRTALETLHGELLADARSFAALAADATTGEGRSEAEYAERLSVARASEVAKQLGWVA